MQPASPEAAEPEGADQPVPASEGLEAATPDSPPAGVPQAEESVPAPENGPEEGPKLEVVESAETPPESPPEESSADISDKVDRLLEELREGTDFASLAAQHSLAPEASEGGLLPPFSHGEMPEVFERAFELKPGKLSDVVESPYGFHIFLLNARFPAREAELEEVRDEIRADLEQERLAELKLEWLRSLLLSSEIRINEQLLETLR